VVATGVILTCVISGGNWSNGVLAGLWNLNLNNNRTNSNYNIGFRCDCLFGLTRSQCLEYRDRIVCYLENALRLTLSKSTIQTIRRGVNFVGYRTWRHKRFIRKFSLYKFRRALREGRIKAAGSILGHAHRTNSLPYMLKLTGESTYAQNIPLPKNYR